MHSKLLALYDKEMRVNPPDQVGVRFERAKGVLRARGRGTWIWSLNLEPADIDQVVSREAKLFGDLGEEVEWKVYGHDRCADLPKCLAAHGFVPDEPETLMFLDLADWRSPFAAPDGIQVRRVVDARGLRGLGAVMSEAFGDLDPGIFDELQATCLADDPLVFGYVAYANDRPVGSGRMESPIGYSFASMWGGCTVPAFRHRGIFLALVSMRVDDARKRGHSYMAVDAAASRAILERLGFRAMTTVTGWRLGAAP